jgi:RNA polymerase sigma factor (sigma-70 family)
LIRAHRKLNDFRGTTSESLNAWLREICVNLCNDHLGRNERRARLARMVTFEECLHNQAKSQNDHDTLIDLYRIRAALAELPDEQRDALVKVKVYGYEAKEVAAARGVPASTIRSQVATALTKLYVALHKDFDLPGKKDTAREGAEPPPVSEPIPEA